MLFAELKGPYYSLFGPVYTAYPVVPAYAVEAHVYGRMHVSLLEAFQHLSGDQLSVGIERIHVDKALVHLVDDIPEVRVDKRFSAGYANTPYSASFQLIQDIDTLLKGKVFSFIIRC